MMSNASNVYRTMAVVITRKYAEFMEDFEQQHDDRRIAFNIYRQIIEACKAMEDMENIFVRVAVTRSISEAESEIDEIITRFTGKAYKGCRWA